MLLISNSWYPGQAIHAQSNIITCQCYVTLPAGIGKQGINNRIIETLFENVKEIAQVFHETAYN
jgi:hypothetical protein